MLGFFSRLMGNREEQQQEEVKPSVAVTAAPASIDGKPAIAYDPELLASLLSDHEELVQLYEAMWHDGIAKGSLIVFLRNLGAFRGKFNAHVLKENVKFYVYLEQNLKHDEHALELIKHFRDDMNEIAKNVLAFCKKYYTKQFTPELKKTLKKDYEAVGDVLVRRVSLEENDLYTLYQPY